MGLKARVLQYGVCEVTQEYKGTAHKGIDIVKEGYLLDYIVCHSDGYVIQINECYENTPNDPTNPGNMVVIDHENGFKTRYLHLQNLRVKAGDYVKKGQILGYMGNTGYSFGGHLHFEVIENGKVIDPTNYLDSDFVVNKKSIEEIAYEVIEGKYGNYPERKENLESLGYDYQTVQNKVNEILNNKDNDDLLELVKKTINGDFGNGEERKNNLGEKYTEVQNQVNLNYQNGTVDNPVIY